jgi:probable F420-dependent oxidoreductase
MKLGAAVFPTDETLLPGEVARLVEERGLESLWFPEHTHIPASRETPYPAGGDLPSMYWRTLDPFVALTAAAAATTRLRLGTGICLVVERDPIITAKEVASLDLLSGGRVEFGVGAGWNREEMRNHGTDPRVRMALMAERVEAIKEIWTHDEASYHGEHVSFDRIWSWPKPVQSPHPRVWVGGNGPTVEDRVLRFGDGWMPNVIDDDELLGRIAALRSRAGRDVPVTINASPRRPERLARYAEAGVERALFYLPSAGREEIEARLDDVQASWREVFG